MPTLTVEKELLELENQYWKAIKARDVDAAIQLTDFPCLVAGATGIGRIDKESFVKMMKGARYTLHEFKITDSEVRLLEDDACHYKFYIVPTLRSRFLATTRRLIASQEKIRTGFRRNPFVAHR